MAHHVPVSLKAINFEEVYEPSPKDPELEEALDNLTQGLYGVRRTDQIRVGRCVACNSEVDATNLRDELSIAEFKISGLCQDCQDSVFGA